MQATTRSTIVTRAMLLIAALLAVQCAPESGPAPGSTPAAETEVEPEEPDLRGAFSVKVIDLLSMRGLAEVDVWVVDQEHVQDSLYPDEDPLAAEQLAHQLGRRFQTDEDGVARIPGGWLESPWICARHGEGFGFQSYAPREYQELALALPPDRELVVQVVDEAGHPVAGVPVGLVVGVMEVEGGMVKKERLTEGERGEARFPHVFSAIRGDLLDYPGELVLHVTFAFPLQNRPSVLLPLHETLVEPVQLVLPPTGSLAVEVEIPEEEESAEDYGERYRYSERIRIADAEDSAGLDFHQVERPVEGEYRDEWAGVLFPHVGLGLELDVTVGYHRPSERFQGPEHAGQRVELTICPGRREQPEYGRSRSDRALTGRCLDADGQPLAARRIRWTVSPIEPFGRLADRPGQDRFRTDEEGRFGFRESSWGGAVAGVPFSALFQTWPRTDDPRECTVVLTSLPDEEEVDLGELRFELTPVALSGHVLDQGGEPVAGARCALVGGPTSKPGSDPWVAGGDTTDEDGFFLIRGTARGEERTLMVRADSCHDSEGVPVTLGDRDVTIRLDRYPESGNLAVVLLIDGIDPGEFLFWSSGLPRVSVERVGTAGELSSPSEASSWRIGEGQLRFELDGLAPGLHLVHVKSPADEPLLALPAEVVVQAGRTTNLRPIDLREKLRGIVIKLVDEQGRTIEAEVNISSSPGNGSKSWRHPRISGMPPGALPIIVDARGTDLTLSVPGYRPAVLEKVRENTEVVMLPEVLPRVRLVLEEPVVLPDPAYQLYFSLDPEDDSPGRKTLSDLRTGTGHLRFEGREVELQVEDPGPWRVCWAVGGKRDGRFRLRWATRRDELPHLEVLEVVEPQVFEIPPPSAELIERLIQELDSASK